MKIIKQCIIAAIHKSILFKFDFLMSIAEGMTMLISNVLFFSLLNQPAENSFSYEQTLLPLFFQVFCGLFYGCFIDNITGLKYYINRGDLDWMMMKPTNLQLYISIRNINLGHIISSVFSILLILNVVLTFDISISLLDLFVSIFFIIVALCCSYSMLLGATSIAIMLTSSGNISGLVLPLISMGRYPRRIFPKAIQYLLFVFFPSLICVDVSVNAFLGNWTLSMLIFSILVSIFQLVVSSKLFYKSFSFYNSTGS